METLLTQFTDAMGQQAGLGGWAAVVGTLGTALLFGVRLFRLLLPGKFERLTRPAQIGAVFACAALGTFGVAIAAQMALGVALGPLVAKLIVTAVGAGIAAIASHHVTKPIGKKVDAMLAERYPASEPGLIRKAGSLVIDIPKPTIHE